MRPSVPCPRPQNWKVGYRAHDPPARKTPRRCGPGRGADDHRRGTGRRTATRPGRIPVVDEGERRSANRSEQSARRTQERFHLTRSIDSLTFFWYLQLELWLFCECCSLGRLQKRPPFEPSRANSAINKGG